jgi:hypothetical protein
MTQPIVYLDTSEVRSGRLAELKAAMSDLARFVQANEPLQPCRARAPGRGLSAGCLARLSGWHFRSGCCSWPATRRGQLTDSPGLAQNLNPALRSL